MAFPLRFSLTQALNSRTLASPSVSASSFVASQISSLSSFPSTSIAHHRHLKLKNLQRKSTGEVPVELDEESKFVPLNPEEMQYGPPALLVLGFELEEHVKLQQFLKELDGEFIQVVYCTEDMLTRSLWDAVSTEQPNLQEIKIAKSVPRICFLSGLTGEEMMMFIDAFPETGLEPAVFAALVPNSADKPVEELIEEIMGDHEMITAREGNEKLLP